MNTNTKGRSGGDRATLMTQDIQHHTSAYSPQSGISPCQVGTQLHLDGPSMELHTVFPIDLKQAASFLTTLDEGTERFCFQTFDDQKTRADRSLARIFNGTLEQHAETLVSLNRQGAGIFVTVNATNGMGRKLENIVRPRAIFQEADRPNTPLPPLTPHIEVESSPGKFHRYWIIDESTAPDLETWAKVMHRMVADFGSDPNARDPARVLRLPGFMHQKDPANPFAVRIYSLPSFQPYTWQQITEIIPPLAELHAEQDAIRARAGRGISGPLQLQSALAALSPDIDYREWIKIGMALHHATDGSGEGYAIWDTWSAASRCYREGETAIKWASFGRYTGHPVSLDSLFFMAREAGWDWTTQQAERIGDARSIVQRVLSDAAVNPKAVLTPTTVEALQIIKANDPLEYEAVRVDIRQANRVLRLSQLDKFVAGTHERDKEANDSLATRLVELAAACCELWHDKDGNVFASMMRENEAGTTHREHWRIDSSGFREWLAWLAHTELEAAPSSETIKSTQNVLSGMAKFDGKEFSFARRVAKDESGHWIDLCDEQWRAILITPAGWRIVDNPSVRFIRNKSMRPLPTPASGSKLDPLWELCNIPEEDRPLVLAWILECYRSETPYPVLELIGEQGSAKSTTQETLRVFIDPNKVMLRARPKGVEDVYVAANSNHLISLENLSGISPELSDALCMIATGGGQAGRQLYTNDEENIIEAHNPVILNGIGAIITRPDLLDRAIALCLPVIHQRMTEQEHATRLADVTPGIFGALLDLFVLTLAALHRISIPPSRRPRMADFAQLGEAMLHVLGEPEGKFLELYSSHRRDAIRRTIESSPVAVACMEFVSSGRRYAGTVKGLLNELNCFAGDMERGDYWPRSPRGLGDALRRIAPALRQIGIHIAVEGKPRRDGVHCELRKVDTLAPMAASTSCNGNSPSQCSPTFTGQGLHEEIRI